MNKNKNQHAKIRKIGYSLKDVAIIPKAVSSVRHRGDVDPYTVVCGRKMLPIFVVPMADVTDEFNKTLRKPTTLVVG